MVTIGHFRPRAEIFVYLFACAFALWLVGQARAAVLHEGIPYKAGLKVDIHVPDEVANSRGSLFQRKRTAPVVLYVHGGGWVKGNRRRVYAMPEWITSRGYIFVAIDYRLIPSTNIDGQVRDVSDSIHWVRNNIKRYGGDPNRIVIMGHSAGAHLVAMIGAKGLGGPLRGIIPNDVQAYDMVAYAAKRGSLGYPYANAFGNNPKNWVAWSPSTFARNKSGMPPHLLMYSKSQGERRRSISIGYANLLKSRGARVTIFHGTRYSHGAIATRLGRPGDPATQAIERFLATVTR